MASDLRSSVAADVKSADIASVNTYTSHEEEVPAEAFGLNSMSDSFEIVLKQDQKVQSPLPDTN